MAARKEAKLPASPPELGTQRIQYLTAMKSFWQRQLESLDQVDFKDLKHALPLARIKKIMKSDEDVRMIGAEAPVLFSKACELFIMDLTMRAWQHAEEGKRKTLQRSDVADAIAHSEMFDFLVDVIPREGEGEGEEEGGTEPSTGSALRAAQRSLDGRAGEDEPEGTSPALGSSKGSASRKRKRPEQPDDDDDDD